MQNLPWDEQLKNLFTNFQLSRLTLSSPKIKKEKDKISLRLIQTTQGYCYQISQLKNNEQMHHINVNAEEAWLFVYEKFTSHYKQCFAADLDANTMQLLNNFKGHISVIKKKSLDGSAKSTMHNRSKNYLLTEGKPLPFLIELGLTDFKGNIIHAKRDKFTQINRFLEFVKDLLHELKKINPLRIVDFGCGKSYLTFALYHFLRQSLTNKIEIIGIDKKNEVIEECQNLALKLNYDGLSFLCGDINNFSPGEKKVDMVIALHACNTATDIALARAVQWKAKIILAAPCCHSELRKQISNEILSPLLRHNILRERFAALLTEAARAELLEVSGYSVDIAEFIDMEHTPKNILIRAILTNKLDKKKCDSYQKLAVAFQITPSLEKLLFSSMDSYST